MRIHRALLILAALSLSELAHAETIYTYTGNPFNSFVQGGNGLTTSDFLSLKMTFANPIAPNTGLIGDIASQTASSLVTVTPTQFTITDGLHTFDNLTSSFFSFDVATDGSGNIGAWDFFAAQFANQTGTSAQDMESQSFLTSAGSFIDSHLLDHSCFVSGSMCASTASVNGSPGTWRVTTTSLVPEPPTLLLLGSGLTGVVSLIRRGTKR